MNTAKKVINLIRSIARDDDYKKLFFSDSELLEKLSLSQNELISEFKENIHYLKIKLKGSTELELPAKIAYIIKLELDGKPLTYTSATTGLKLKEPCFFYLRGYTYMLYNVTKGDELEIMASFFSKELKSPNDSLALSAEFNKALALRVVLDTLLVERSSADLQPRMQILRSEYELAKSKIRSLKNIANTPNITYTKHHI